MIFVRIILFVEIKLLGLKIGDFLNVRVSLLVFKVKKRWFNFEIIMVIFIMWIYCLGCCFWEIMMFVMNVGMVSKYVNVLVIILNIFNGLSGMFMDFVKMFGLLVFCWVLFIVIIVLLCVEILVILIVILIMFIRL